MLKQEATGLSTLKLSYLNTLASIRPMCLGALFRKVLRLLALSGPSKKHKGLCLPIQSITSVAKV
jgi:hypothetical protein